MPSPNVTEKPSPARSRARAAARWLALAAIVSAGLIGLEAAVAPWLFSPTALVDAIAVQLQGSSGLYVSARGRARFSLLPRPTIAVDSVSFADRNGALFIDADALRGDVDLLPLVAGRLNVAAVTLVRPRATLNLDEKRIDAPGAAARAAAAKPTTPQAAAADKLRFGVVSVVDGAARIAYRGRDYALDKIDATFEWRRIGEAATLTGAFDFGGERLEAMLWAARPIALLRGEQSIVAGRLDGESLRFDAQGLAQLGANARFEGRIGAATPFVRQTLGLFGLQPPLPGRFDDGQFSAEATFGPQEAQFKNARIFVDGNEFQGELAFQTEDGRPCLTAKLKSEFLSLRPLLVDAPALVGPDGQWTKETFELPDLSGVDVDLHLAVAHARLGRLKLEDAAVAVALRDGALELAIDEAQAYRGKLKLRASFAPSGSGLALRANAQASGVDAGPLLWDAFGKPAFSGALDATIALNAEGDGATALMRSLDGRASVALATGDIAGIDLERALRRLEKRPLSSALDIHAGRSTLDQANATIKIEKGVAEINEGVARGPGFTLAFDGVARIPERGLALKALAREADDAGKAKDKGVSISFDISGGWDELALTSDAQAFIRRSDAAAPLLPPAEPIGDKDSTLE
ncbi:AsmA family protein [Methylocystis sp. 9N]|uniref:AsmA family protein n=1 Tax=Methylocystis borbori TaxID=3118750 RepID=A0ABU7XFS4_9HYPH